MTHFSTGGPRVLFRRLRSSAVVPSYHSAHAAGMDLSACLESEEAVEILPGEVRLIPTGWAVAIPEGYEGQVRPRSGLASRHGVTVVNAPGTIDSDYRGEVVVALINMGRRAYRIEPGARVAQLVIAPVSRARVVEADVLPPTERGEGGFGSTGI